MTHTVLIQHCEGYDPDRIRQVIGEGMDALGIRPEGRTLVKPNLVVAHPRFYPQAFTRPEFIDGLLGALKERSEAVTELALGERSGITVPTRLSAKEVGYFPVMRRHRVRMYYFEEWPSVEYRLTQPGALRPYIMIPEPVARTDFLVNAPKLKAHAWTKMTCALKNYIGIQDSGHRMIDHDFRLERKIADLNHVLPQRFIAVDAITAGELTMMTPAPRDLNLILMGTNPVAVDVVAAAIIGLDPLEVEHVRVSGEQGLGPLSLSDITTAGDVTLIQAQQRARGFRLSIEKVDKVFNDRSNLRMYVGPPPTESGVGYCWGGCPGALYEAVESLRRSWDADVYHNVRPLHYVFGAYEGKIDAKPGERVIFMGDCSTWRGEIFGKQIEVPSTYKSHKDLNPRRDRKPIDLVLKIVGHFIKRIRYAGQPHIKITDCPVTVAEHYLILAFMGGAPNPYLEPEIVLRYAANYIVVTLVRFWRVRLLGLFRRPQSRAVPQSSSAASGSVK